MVYWAKQIPTQPVSALLNNKNRQEDGSSILAPASLGLNWSFFAVLFRGNLQYYSKQHILRSEKQGLTLPVPGTQIVTNLLCALIYWTVLTLKYMLLNIKG